MKTAINQAIEELYKIATNKALSVEYRAAIAFAIQTVQELESVNEQQIIEAHDRGVLNAKLQQTVLYTNGEEYFTQTFKKL